MDLLVFLAGLAGGALAWQGWSRWRTRQPEGDPAPVAVEDTDGPGATTTEPAPTVEPVAGARDRLFQLKRDIEALDDRIQSPDDLLALPEFEEAVALLAGSAFTPADVIEHLGSGGYVLPCIAARALMRRPDSDPAAALGATLPFGGYPLRFVLDYLRALPDASTLPLLLRHGRDWWWDATAVRQRLREYFAWAADHAPGHGPVPLDDLDDDRLAEQQTVLCRFQLPLLQPYVDQVAAELANRREHRVLGGFGRVLGPPRPQLRYAHPGLDSAAEQLLDRLAGPAPASVLVVGEHGVGKSVLVDGVVERLHGDGWLVFEASAAEILAGQKYVGELEGRVREMLGVLHRRKALWRVPDFFDLLHKGAHSQDPRGILDLVLPAIERGELRVVGELTPGQMAQLLVKRPALKHHFEAILVSPASGSMLEGIAAQWAEAAGTRLGSTVAEPRILGEAMRMAAQYFPEQHEPGRLLRLLDETLQAAQAQDPPALPLTTDSLLETIARRSGLPLDVIDDRQSLDLAGLSDFFRRRVLGQDEAVECLVDRIAMLKAGLVDGSRPVGVFLFAGPTGTGKTELAKALGELLFGSGDRLLRLDMSEYQTDDAAWRLLGDGDREGARSLTARIREQPFSVVLLDEFEKAHPRVWDLFLQVFDDGRLSDRSGNTADFRHSIIVLTSNVGSTLSRSAGPGFTASAGGYSRAAVEKALADTFRAEFLNRLDRVVLFNPLDRALMRQILHKELARVLDRRGLRNRDWAVEWEPSAIEFLLDRGFTPDLGARPLRRAIEHHLLAPLARTIVEHRAPQGDQFLFVRSAGDRLEVEFIDPAPERSCSSATSTEAAPDVDTRDLVYAPELAGTALERLEGVVHGLRARLASPAWSEGRERDFAAMAAPDFWSDAGRFEVLDRIERRDRIENALAAAQRLSDRMAAGSATRELIGHQAQLVFLLGLAVEAVLDQRPQDALVEIRLWEPDRLRQEAEAKAWWRALVDMYQRWAQRRNMRVEALSMDDDEGLARLAVSGFGALDLLLPEAGLHVMEHEQDDAATRRVSVRVRVAPHLPGRERRMPSETGEATRVSRRYRGHPSPLVRDGVRGWRTGRLDRVLAGEFDVIPLQE